MDRIPSRAVGIDIGGTQTKFGLVDVQGAISEFRAIPTSTEGDPRPYLDMLVEHVADLISLAGAPVVGIGYSLHGFIDAERTGAIVCPNTPTLRGLNLRRWMAERFDLPVIVNQDLTAHALAEYHFGSGQGIRRFLCLAIGTGLGAGVIIDGQAQRFLGGCPGDNGHIIIKPGGPRCSMGCRGCAEALCGTAGIERLARERLGGVILAHDVISGAHEGNPDMVPIVEQIGAWIGTALASLCSVFLPERVALTGGTAEAGEVLRRAAEERFRELVGAYHDETVRAAPHFYRGVEIVTGKLRGQTGVAGAVAELLRGD